MPIGVVAVDVCASLAARRHVVDAPGDLEAKWSCHSAPRFPRMEGTAEESLRCRDNDRETSSEWKIALQYAESIQQTRERRCDPVFFFATAELDAFSRIDFRERR